MGLLKTLLIIAFVYYALKAIRVYVLPVLGRMALKKAQEKMQEKMQEQFQQERPQEKRGGDNREEGDVKVVTRPENDQKIKNDTIGDYVDFEEVD